MTAARAMTRRVVIALAICLACQPAWGHSFPSVRTVVVQVERCELAILVGYRPASGVATDAVVAQVASYPKSRVIDALKGLLAARAMAPLTLTLDGKPLAPTSVQAKISLATTGARPTVVVLAIYPVPAGGGLAVTSAEPHRTRISWTDRDSGRVELDHAPGQARWFAGVASFLLSLRGLPGDSACAPSSSSP
jgi:hypothetical protein